MSLTKPRARVLLIVPARIQTWKHMQMIRVQSLLKRRLAPHLPGVELVSALVTDDIKKQFRQSVAKIGQGFDRYEDSIPEGHGDQGIRRPTNYAVTVLAEETNCDYVLRVNQDSPVADTAILARDIGRAMATHGDWIAGHVHYWKTHSHQRLCSVAGIAFTPELHYLNGTLCMAPTRVWRQFYVPMPKCIHHDFDDVIFSETFRQVGSGTMIDFNRPCWRRLRNASGTRFHHIYKRHMWENVDDAPPLRATPVFVHVPKNAGCSIVQAFKSSRVFFRNGNHTPARQICVAPNDRFVAVVRNPWDRLVSCYFYLKRGGINQQDRRDRDRFLHAFNDFPTFVRSLRPDSPVLRQQHFRPQSWYLSDCSRPIRTLRFENLANDWEQMHLDWNMSYCPLDHKNGSKHEDYRTYYTSETVEIVCRLYAEDVESFGYTFDDNEQKISS